MARVDVIWFYLIWFSISMAYVTKTSTLEFNIYNVGDMNLILTAPHGGTKDPDKQLTDNSLDWPDRTAGCWRDSACVWQHDCGVVDETRCKASTLNDLNTKSIVLAIADDIYNITGMRPHVILADVRRRKVDVNREVEEAAQEVGDAILAYNDFHDFVKEARDSILPNQGLLIDVHGQTHVPERVELGYDISISRLDSGDYWPTLSTIEYNGKKICPDDNSQSPDHECFYKLIRGSESLGKFLSDNGVAAIPGPEYHSPDGTGYFSGGYIVETHGSKIDGTVDAIQMELPRGIRNDFDSYKTKLTMSLLEYYKLHYDSDLNLGTTTESGTTKGLSSSTSSSTIANAGTNSGSESLVIPKTSLVSISMLCSIVNTLLSIFSIHFLSD